MTNVITRIYVQGVAPTTEKTDFLVPTLSHQMLLNGGQLFVRI